MIREPTNTYLLGVALGLAIAVTIYAGGYMIGRLVERSERARRKWRLR